jgi:aspartyl protease family protein
MSNNEQSFKNNEIKRYSISPLLASQPSVHYLLVKTNVGSKFGQTDPVKVPLLVDTGASYTTLPVKVLNDLGYDTQNPDKWHPGIVTGRGHTSRIPIVQVSSFSCLGKQIIDWPILAYTLPQPTYWRGVLGMDFLTHFRAVILLENYQTGQADRIVLR